MCASARGTVSRKAGLAIIVWVATFALAVLRVHFLNDHFDRISRARQILAYGDHPFADFRDPGYFLTLYVSAAAQGLTGGSLLGEALVASAAIAAAAAMTFWLAESASGSLLIGVIAACLTWVVSPRYYDYDKVLFYMAGVALCWRYVDSPTRGRLAALGIVTALAAIFRYDNGLYVMAASLAAIVVRRQPNGREMVSDVCIYIAVIAASIAPALVFIQATAGVAEAFRQIAAYASREGHRSNILEIPRLGLDSSSIAYILTIAMPPVALMRLAWARAKDATFEFPEAKIIAVTVLSLCVAIFVLRDPIGARIGAAFPLTLVLAAWMARPWRFRRRGAALAVAAVGGLIVVAAFPQQVGRLQRAPSAIARRLSAVTSGLSARPPSVAYFPDDGALAGMASYLRACTPADARVLVTWFAPEIFFFSQRGFAGGMVVFLGEHWSSKAHQRRTIDQMNSQVVPLVIVTPESADALRATFPLIAAYLEERYRLAGTTSFGDRRLGEETYRVLIKRDLGTVPTERDWKLPCPTSASRR